MLKVLEGALVSEPFVARLTARKGLTLAQIRTAVRFAKLASAAGDTIDAQVDAVGMQAILAGGRTALMGR